MLNPPSGEIFIAYELRHVDEACSQAQRGTTIVCFDFLIERQLKKKGIPLVSLRDFVDTDTGEEGWWELAQEVAREWYRLPALSFFQYEHIRIAEVIEPLLMEYLGRLFYYARICTALKAKYPGAHFYLPVPTERKSPVCLAELAPWALRDAACMTGLAFEDELSRPEPSYEFPQESWKSRLLGLYNAVVGLAPRRRLKVYTSAYWSYVAPIIPFLDETELLIWESTAFYKIPLRTILKHRIRIMSSHGPVSKKEVREAEHIAGTYTESWPMAREEVARYLKTVRTDLDWTPVLRALDSVIRYAPRVVADIRTLTDIMERERPDVVLPLASTGGPEHYFYLMAKVARNLGIPSLELQHAGAFIDPRSVISRIETDALATYGENVNEYHERLGHSRGQLFSVGSPRFDQYVTEQKRGTTEGARLLTQFGLDPARPVLLATVLFSDTSLSAVDIDSYQLAGFIQTVRKIREQSPDLQVLFKFRAYKYVGAWREYIQELFKSGVAIAGEEDIFPLLCASSAVVCGNSTVIYQALLAHKPLVLYPWKVFDRVRAEMYAPAAPLFYAPTQSSEAGSAVARIFADPAYRDELLARQAEFLKGYSFDGRSSERVARLLIAQKA